MVLKPSHFSRPLAKADKRGREACLSLNITWVRLEFEEILELAEVSGVRQMQTCKLVWLLQKYHATGRLCGVLLMFCYTDVSGSWVINFGNECLSTETAVWAINFGHNSICVNLVFFTEK